MEIEKMIHGHFVAFFELFLNMPLFFIIVHFLGVKFEFFGQKSKKFKK
jgi:hypothetical protein